MNIGGCCAGGQGTGEWSRPFTSILCRG